MAKLVFKSDLSVDGLSNLIHEIENYAYVLLPNKVNECIRLLAERGIEVAEENVKGEFKPCIDFVYEQTGNGSGRLIGKNTTLIHRVWYNKSGKIRGEADVSPILMAEWGAGKYAVDGHRGTFPNQKNASRDKWYWYDDEGNKHCSDEDDLIIPSHPMHSAYVEMVTCYNQVIREVFA